MSLLVTLFGTACLVLPCFSTRYNVVILNPTAQHEATVFWFHGLGDVGQSWADALLEIRNPHVKYICPTAHMRKTTFDDAPTSAWYGSREDVQGITNSINDVHAMLDAEIAAGTPANRIIVGGFSQGGALAIQVGFRYSKKLAGVVSLSGYILLPTQLPGNFNKNRDTVYLLGHGTEDQVVEAAQSTYQTLSKFCSNVVFKTYIGMGHSISRQEMQDVRKFIADRAM